MVTTGVVSFYKDFVESLYELLGGTVSVTGKRQKLLFRLFMYFTYFRFWLLINNCLFRLFFLLVCITSCWARISYKEGTAFCFCFVSTNQIYPLHKFCFLPIICHTYHYDFKFLGTWKILSGELFDKSVEQYEH